MAVFASTAGAEPVAFSATLTAGNVTAFLDHTAYSWLFDAEQVKPSVGNIDAVAWSLIESLGGSPIFPQSWGKFERGHFRPVEGSGGPSVDPSNPRVQVSEPSSLLMLAASIMLFLKLNPKLRSQNPGRAIW